METRPKANYDHDNDQFRAKTKRLLLRMTAQSYNRFVFVSWSWYLPCNGNQALEENRFGETTNQDSHCHGYALFQSVLKQRLPPSLNLNHNTYSTFPLIHVKLESMAHGTKEHFNFTRA